VAPAEPATFASTESQTSSLGLSTPEPTTPFESTAVDAETTVPTVATTSNGDFLSMQLCVI